MVIIMNKLSKKYCIGCKDNYYNYGNNSDIGECWMLKSAKLEKKLDIPMDMRPPYDKNKKFLTKKPSCFKKKGYCRVSLDSLDSNGYWLR